MLCTSTSQDYGYFYASWIVSMLVAGLAFWVTKGDYRMRGSIKKTMLISTLAILVGSLVIAAGDIIIPAIQAGPGYILTMQGTGSSQVVSSYGQLINTAFPFNFLVAYLSRVSGNAFALLLLRLLLSMKFENVSSSS